ncbi:MAG: DUF998 domain-containing protein [Candidatus Helarchaeota archaeon]
MGIEEWLLDTREVLVKAHKSAYDFITNYTTVKYSLYAALCVFFPFLIIAVIVAAFSPSHYTILTNWISDLGSFNHTPAPFLLDINFIISGILLIPTTHYLEKTLAPIPTTEEEMRKILAPRIKFQLASYGYLFAIIGNIGLILVGAWSEDVSSLLAPLTGGMDILHGIASVLAFGGFFFSTIFYGLLIVLSKSIYPKSLGLYGIFGPFFIMLFTILIMLGMRNINTYLLEWMLLFVIIGWIVPVSLVILLRGEKEG